MNGAVGVPKAMIKCRWFGRAEPAKKKNGPKTKLNLNLNLITDRRQEVDTRNRVFLTPISCYFVLCDGGVRGCGFTVAVIGMLFSRPYQDFDMNCPAVDFCGIVSVDMMGQPETNLAPGRGQRGMNRLEE